MSTITTRSGKGSPLTNSEVDTNFTNLNTDKLENITGESIKNLSDVNSSMSPSAGDALVYDASNGWQSGTVSTGAVANTVIVTVANSKFVIDGTSQQALTLSPSVTYRFDQSNNSNANHPLKFSTTDNGTHNSGSEFTTGVTVSGTAGSTDAYVEIKLEQDAPSTLYYYCGNHSNMGGAVSSGGSTAISVQDEGSALSTAAETLNFTGAGVTASGTGAAKTINIPGATVSTNGSLDPVKQTEFTATANQTSFSVAYGVGNISVYHNGAKLAAADFTATNGTSVVLAAGATVGDLLVVEEYGIPFASPYTASIYTASAGQTTLSVNYTVSKVAVSVNGVKLYVGTDVTAANGTSLTFTNALSAGDKIEVVEHGALVETTTTFAGLTDTPSSLGSAGQLVQVNSAGNALEFADASGGGASSINDLSDAAWDGSNLSIGTNSFSSGTSHYRNVAIGWNTGNSSITTGDDNILIGRNTGSYVTTGTANTAVGQNALQGTNVDKLTGSNNVGIGQTAGSAVTSGSSNTFVGDDSNGSGNVNYQSALGYNATTAGAGATALTDSRASGADSLAAAIANNSSSYGATGANTIAIGKQAKALGTAAIALGESSQGTGAYGVAVGHASQASGLGSVAIGNQYYVGPARASGGSSIAIGDDARATQKFSTAIGSSALSEIIGKYAFAGGRFAARGDSQGGQFILRADTTDATATVLTTDNATAASTNQIVAASDTCITFDGTITAMQNGAQAYASWRIEGLLVNDGGTTTLANSATTVISNGSSWGMALSADNTNNALAITVTGEASHNIRWVANIRTTEVTYA